MKLTFSVAILFGLVAAMFQATPALSQTKPGSIFKVVPTPNENQTNNALDAASASSPKDIWAVGESTIHFDGTKWTAFPAPFIDGVDNFLTGVVDISPTLAWAVGNVSEGENPFQQVIEQWDGKEWSVFPGPNFPRILKRPCSAWPRPRRMTFGQSAVCDTRCCWLQPFRALGRHCMDGDNYTATPYG